MFISVIFYVVFLFFEFLFNKDLFILWISLQVCVHCNCVFFFSNCPNKRPLMFVVGAVVPDN